MSGASLETVTLRLHTGRLEHELDGRIAADRNGHVGDRRGENPESSAETA